MVYHNFVTLHKKTEPPVVAERSNYMLYLSNAKKGLRSQIWILLRAYMYYFISVKIDNSSLTVIVVPLYLWDAQDYGIGRSE